MVEILNMTNDRLHCRRGPAGGSLALSAPAFMTMLDRPAGQISFRTGVPSPERLFRFWRIG
jgi:hypothetical protein